MFSLTGHVLRYTGDSPFPLQKYQTDWSDSERVSALQTMTSVSTQFGSELVSGFSSCREAGRCSDEGPGGSEAANKML